MRKLNKFKKILMRIVAKGAYLILALAFLGVNFSSSQFFDLEVSAGNTLAIGVLDLTLTPQGDNFIPHPDQMRAGDTVSRTIDVGNGGSIPLQYRGEYQNTGGNPLLCAAYQLTVTANGTDVIYTGALTSFTNFFQDMILNGSENDSLLFEINLPIGTDPSLSLQTCDFNFDFIAWQSDLTEGQGFTDEETLAVSLGTNDFEPPSVPILEWPIYGKVTSDNTPLMQWTDSTDNVGVAGYYYRIYIGSPAGPVWPNASGLPVPVSQLQAGTTADNNYYWQVRAEDVNGNLSDWSELEHFVIDTSAGITTFYTHSSPLRQIKDDVLNGDFEYTPNRLEKWTIKGNVEVLNEDSIAGGPVVKASDILPNQADNHMVKIIPASEPDGDLYYSSLTQEIPNSAKTLSFWYNFATRESDALDNPGFSVYINEKEVFQVWSSDFLGTAEEIAVSGWQKFYYDLNSFDMGEHPILTIVFYAGNRLDEGFDSWIYLDKISTNDVYVNANTKLHLQTSDGLSATNSFYKLGPCNDEFNPDNYTQYEEEFSLTHAAQDNKFCYLSQDAAGNIEAQHEVNLIFDDDPPDQITDLDITSLYNGEFKLDWTAVDPHDPTGNQIAAYYLMKYSETAITAENFDSAADYQAQSPRPDGEPDQLELTGLSPGPTYYFAIKACDAASNCGPISDVVSAASVSDTEAGGVGGTRQVVINELMWMGSNEAGAGDEWVELRNMTGVEVSLYNWQIIKKRSDGVEQCMFTFPLGAKIAPNGFVVVSEYDSAHSAFNITCPAANCFVVGDPAGNDQTFSLANSKLQLKLYDGYWVLPTVNLVDTADDGVGAPAAGDGVLFRSMERNNIPGNGADPNNWHTCLNPLSSMYWDAGVGALGTPGGLNLSEPSPSPSASLEPSPSPSLEPSPSPGVESSPSPSPSPSLEPSPSPSGEPGGEE